MSNLLGQNPRQPVIPLPMVERNKWMVMPHISDAVRMQIFDLEDFLARLEMTHAIHGKDGEMLFLASPVITKEMESIVQEIEYLLSCLQN